MPKSIEDSDPSDWTYITRPVFAQDMQQVSGGGQPVPWVEVEEHNILLSYKQDLSISIVSGLPHTKEFAEDWVEKFPDKRASSSWVDFRYNGVTVLRELIVHVDGGRVSLPCLEPGSLDIPQRQYRIWQIMDNVVGSGKFSEYFKRAGFKVTKEHWPSR
jgi:hypothetical protein